MLLFALQETYDTVTAVIGNEACDLDSIVSSILYGYCVQHEVTAGKRGGNSCKIKMFFTVAWRRQ